MNKVASFPDGLLAGELARLAGVSTDTLRHYERKGVLPGFAHLFRKIWISLYVYPDVWTHL
jgi:MerR family regulatory protein